MWGRCNASKMQIVFMKYKHFNFLGQALANLKIKNPPTHRGFPNACQLERCQFACFFTYFLHYFFISNSHMRIISTYVSQDAVDPKMPPNSSFLPSTPISGISYYSIEEGETQILIKEKRSGNLLANDKESLVWFNGTLCHFAQNADFYGSFFFL